MSSPLYTPVRILKSPDDPTCLRVSMGGTKDMGYYLIFRGDREAVLHCIETLHAALKSGVVPIEEDNDPPPSEVKRNTKLVVPKGYPRY